MGWHNEGFRLSGSGSIDASKGEVLVLLLSEPFLGELVNCLDPEESAESVDGFGRLDFVPSQVVISNVGLSRLVQPKVVWQLLSSQEQSEIISTVVSEMNFSDFNSVISQVVVDHEGQFLELAVEAKNLQIVVQELLLAFHSTSSK